jgi:hypothetical protein
MSRWRRESDGPPLHRQRITAMVPILPLIPPLSPYKQAPGRPEAPGASPFWQPRGHQGGRRQDQVPPGRQEGNAPPARISCVLRPRERAPAPWSAAAPLSSVDNRLRPSTLQAFPTLVNLDGEEPKGIKIEFNIAAPTNLPDSKGSCFQQPQLQVRFSWARRRGSLARAAGARFVLSIDPRLPPRPDRLPPLLRPRPYLAGRHPQFCPKLLCGVRLSERADTRGVLPAPTRAARPSPCRRAVAGSARPHCSDA